MDNQLDLLDVITLALFNERRAKRLRAPTIKEVAKATGCCDSNAYDRMKRLERAELIAPIRKPGGAQPWPHAYSNSREAVRMRQWRNKKRASTPVGVDAQLKRHAGGTADS